MCGVAAGLFNSGSVDGYKRARRFTHASPCSGHSEGWNQILKSPVLPHSVKMCNDSLTLERGRKFICNILTQTKSVLWKLESFSNDRFASLHTSPLFISLSTTKCSWNGANKVLCTYWTQWLFVSVARKPWCQLRGFTHLSEIVLLPLSKNLQY